MVLKLYYVIFNETLNRNPVNDQAITNPPVDYCTGCSYEFMRAWVLPGDVLQYLRIGSSLTYKGNVFRKSMALQLKTGTIHH